jgi:peptidoglycan hydrolase CwlO-like protein
MLSGDGFYSSIASYTVTERLEKDIRDQEEVTKKTQKKYDDLVKDQASLEKKIKNLQEDLEDNKKKQETQVTEVETQRKILEQLKSKRNS